MIQQNTDTVEESASAAKEVIESGGQTAQHAQVFSIKRTDAALPTTTTSAD